MSLSCKHLSLRTAPARGSYRSIPGRTMPWSDFTIFPPFSHFADISPLKLWCRFCSKWIRGALYASGPGAPAAHIHLSIAQIDWQEQPKGSLQFVNPFALLKNVIHFKWSAVIFWKIPTKFRIIHSKSVRLEIEKKTEKDRNYETYMLYSQLDLNNNKRKIFSL